MIHVSGYQVFNPAGGRAAPETLESPRDAHESIEGLESYHGVGMDASLASFGSGEPYGNATS